MSVSRPAPAIGGLLAAGIALACARSPQPTPDAGVITGTVAYRERMALPPDAVVEVQLSDVSRQDVAAPIVAETTMRPEGRQVPLPFELRYDRGRIEPDHSYAVRAAIRSEGRVLFNAAGLAGTSWVLEDIGGSDVLDDARATLEFPEAGTAAGGGSCNRFFGRVEAEGGRIAFGPLGSTRMACAEAVMHREGSYLKALQEAERYVVDGAMLLIYTKATDQPLRFTRDAP